MSASQKNSIYRISHYLFKYRWLFILTLTLALGQTGFFVAAPMVIEYVIDELVGQASVWPLVFAGIMLLGCYGLRDLLNMFRIRVNNTLEQNVLIDLRKELHDKLLVLPISFYDRRKSGDIASRVVEDVNEVERALLDGTEQGVTAIFTLVGITVILFVKQPLLATFMFLPIPILILLALNHAKATRKNWKRVRDSSGLMNSLLIEDIQANRLIHSFALQKKEATRFQGIARELKKFTLKAMWRWSSYSSGTNFISSFGLVAVVAYGGYMLYARPEAFSYGEFVAFFAYATMLNDPLGRLHGINHMLAAGKAAGDRVFEILDHPVDVKSPDTPRPFPREINCIEYRNVDFAYPERPEVLQRFNLSLNLGETTALVGHTGAGKSTVANLLLRYYDVTGGTVTIDGVDVREFDLAELRSNIGYVAQEPFLFDGTVRSNMELANPEANEADIVEALRSARAWSFVEKLPEGMDTLIGERGVRLSQGEKQRITIARILLRNPQIIILDEATSSVDTETEKYIQEALDELTRNRTVLVIAHRLSTIRSAHQIVCLDHGKILEKGNHDELIMKDGQYAKLWSIQADFIPEGV